MAYNRGTEALDLNATPQRKTRASAQAAPQRAPRREPAQRPQVVRKSKSQLKAERRRSSAYTIRALAVCGLCLMMVALQIFGHARSDELDRELATINSEIGVLESENTRLNMELDSKISLDKVDEYAQNVLGMVKVENYQVSYVNLAGDDTVEVSGGKVKRSMWETIKAYLF